MTAIERAESERGAATECRQFLTFTLGEESYGVDILGVQEIKGYAAVTRIPNTPPYIEGVLNLRGAVIPVFDLRAKFNMAQAAHTPVTVIVVVVVRQRVVGLVVDAVSDVLDIDRTAIHPPPAFGRAVDVGFLDGIGQCGGKMVALLNIERLVGEGEELIS